MACFFPQVSCVSSMRIWTGISVPGRAHESEQGVQEADTAKAIKIAIFVQDRWKSYSNKLYSNTHHSEGIHIVYWQIHSSQDQNNSRSAIIRHGNMVRSTPHINIGSFSSGTHKMPYNGQWTHIRTTQTNKKFGEREKKNTLKMTFINASNVCIFGEHCRIDENSFDRFEIGHFRSKKNTSSVFSTASYRPYVLFSTWVFVPFLFF